jgi:hypothetical protein
VEVNWSEKCKGPGGGDRRGALCTRVHTSHLNLTTSSLVFFFRDMTI